MNKSVRWTVRPENANWGDFGENDQLGRLNLLTPEIVKQSVLEIKEGLTFSLSLPLDLPGGTVMNPRRPPLKLEPTQRGEYPNMTYPLSRDDPALTDVICDDSITFALQYSTHMDSLAHMGQWFDVNNKNEPKMSFYNGYQAGIDIIGEFDFYENKPSPEGKHVGALALGIDTVAKKGIQGRGVMIDIHKHFGDKRFAFGYNHLMDIINKDHIEIKKGDIVYFHTGMGQALLDMGGQPNKEFLFSHFAGLDGRDKALQQWIIDTEIVAIMADNPAVEILPANKPTDNEKVYPSHPLHHLCLFRLGVFLGEFCYLTELCNWLNKNNRNSFFTTIAPLRIPKAVASPITPIATV